ncbi:hypothetical protein [Microbacterium gilvum]|uniref:ABC transporter permease n=1 Tax=Microbacterium gilvum TaxID=1336204 RepID=A0ABP9A133_9MICO
MSTATAAPRRLAPSVGAPRLTFAHLVRAEWIALSSLRGSIVTLIVGSALVVLASVGLTAMMLALTDAAEGMAPPALTMTLNGAAVAQIVAVLVGVSVFAKEHATGSLRTQLAAAPRRAATIGAKAVVVGVASFAWSLAALAVSFAGVVAVSAAAGAEVPFDDALTQIALPIAGAAFFVALVGVFSLGMAVLLRSETWSVTLVLVFLLMIPTVLLTLPFEWAPTVAEYLLGSAGEVFSTAHAEITGEVVRDAVVAIAWPAAALVAGMAVLSRRDA